MDTSTQGTLGAGPYAVLVVIALVVLAFTKSEVGSWADASRIGSIQGLVEQGTLALDDTDFLFQGDKVRIGGPLAEGGHFYSHQPPMLAILGAAPYWALHEMGWRIDDPATYKVITLSVVGLPVMFGLFCLARLMRIAGLGSRETTWLLAAAGFGTLLLPYTLVLNQHAPAAGLVMAALLQTQRRRFGWAGGLLGLATAIDLTAAFFAIAALLPMARLGGRWAVLQYSCCGLPPLLFHSAITYGIVGDILPLALHTEGFEYPGSPFLLMSLTGALREVEVIPSGAYVFHALFGASGLFSHHPVLLLALATGAMAVFEQVRARGDAPAGSDPSRALGLAPSMDHAILVGTMGICIFYLTQSRNFGGAAFGMRWFCVFAPSLLLLIAHWQVRHAPGRFASFLFPPLLLWSVSAAALGAAQPWTKVTYRWQNTPYGKIALERGGTVSFFDHATLQLYKMSVVETEFKETRWRDDFLRKLNEHRLAYLTQHDGQSYRERRTRLEAGLARLDRVIELYDREGGDAKLHAWARFWRARFRSRLGRRAGAAEDLRMAAELDKQLRDTTLEARMHDAPTEHANASAPEFFFLTTRPSEAKRWWDRERWLQRAAVLNR